MRKTKERGEGVERGFEVFYPDVYDLENEQDCHKLIKCSSCGRLTEICQAKRSPVTTPFGDIVAADVDELWCSCGGHLGTMDNRAGMIILDKQAILVE